MGWVLSMGVVEGLSAEEIPARLEAELGEETIGYSTSFEEVEAGLALATRPGVIWSLSPVALRAAHDLRAGFGLTLL